MSSADDEYEHGTRTLECGRDTWRLEDSLIPRDRKIGENNCKAQCQVVLSCYATPFYATLVLVHTYLTSRMYNYTRPA